MSRRLWALAIVLVARTAPAHAYEFWLRTRTYGQAYQLREYRLVGPDLFLGRRRFTQTVALRIWDIGGLAAARRRARLPDTGLRITWQSYLRIDHDFGQWTSGRIKISEPTRRDAIDVVPELAESAAGLQLLYGYLALDGIADGRVSLQLGRVMADDGWGASGVDGGAVTVAVPATPIAITVTGGLRVRAASWLGTSTLELDGTSGAGCREYVEGPTPGTGTWKLIDRNRTITNTRLASDYEYCPQREVRQPTIGAVATAHLRRLDVEVGYRRTWSPTVGRIGRVDRLDFPDLGLYPNEFGQVPDSGVNEERVRARLSSRLGIKATRLQLEPYLGVRYSLLHAALDRFELGTRVARGAHAIEPALEYFYPTFDGDSIFNVFSIEPTMDARLGYRYDGAVRLHAKAWLRRYSGSVAYAGGGELSVERAVSRVLGVRLGGLADDGFGGRRVGGTGEARWQTSNELRLGTRVIVLGIAPDDGRPRYVTTTAEISASYRLGDTAALHAVGDGSFDDRQNGQLRALLVLDLAFAPEP